MSHIQILKKENNVIISTMFAFELEKIEIETRIFNQNSTFL